jgi:hypothetical protein
MKSLRLINYLGDDHGYLKSNGVDMNDPYYCSRERERDLKRKYIV